MAQLSDKKTPTQTGYARRGLIVAGVDIPTFYQRLGRRHEWMVAVTLIDSAVLSSMVFPFVVTVKTLLIAAIWQRYSVLLLPLAASERSTELGYWCFDKKTQN